MLFERTENTVKSIYFLDPGLIPASFLKQQRKEFYKKYVSGKFLSRDERVLFAYFIYSLIQNSNGLPLNKERIYGLFNELKTDNEIKLLAKGYFDFCFSQENLFPSNFISLVQKKIESNNQTKFLTPFFVKDNLKERIVEKKTTLFSELILSLGRGIINIDSLFSHECWKIFASSTDLRVSTILRTEGVNGLIGFVNDLFCTDSKSFILRSFPQKELEDALKLVESFLTKENYPLSNREVAAIVDLFDNLGGRLFFEYSEIFIQLYLQRNQKELTFYESIDKFRDYLHRPIDKSLELQLIRLLNTLRNKNRSSVTLLAEKIEPFEYFQSSPYEGRVQRLDFTGKEKMIIVYSFDKELIALYPTLRIIRHKSNLFASQKPVLEDLENAESFEFDSKEELDRLSSSISSTLHLAVLRTSGLLNRWLSRIG